MSIDESQGQTPVDIQTAVSSGQLLNSVLDLVKRQLIYYAYLHGYRPRAASTYRARERMLYEMQTPYAESVSKKVDAELDQLVDTVGQWLGFPKNQRKSPENRALIKTVLKQIEKYFPGTLDTLLAPNGSASELAGFVAASHAATDPQLSRKAPDGRTLAEYLTDYIYKHFYSDQDKEIRLQKTRGLTAGQLGGVLYHLTEKGVIDPAVDTPDQIVKKLEYFVPAVGEAQRWLQKTKPDADLQDAVNFTVTFNSMLPPSPSGFVEKDYLLKNLLADIRKNELLAHQFSSGAPGALPSEEAVKQHKKRVQQLRQSEMGAYYGAILAAKKMGLIKSRSRAGYLAEKIENGTPVVFRNSSEVVDALVRSGVAPNIATQLVSNPEMTSQYLTGGNVDLAMTGAQSVQARRNMWQLFKTYRKAGLKGGPKAAFNLSLAQTAAAYGYPDVEQFRQMVLMMPPGTMAMPTESWTPQRSWVARTLPPTTNPITAKTLPTLSTMVSEEIQYPELAPSVGSLQRIIATMKDIAKEPPESKSETLSSLISGAVDLTKSENKPLKDVPTTEMVF